MDELLTSAYDELVGSVSPPPDARQRVAARRAQRRRRRHVGYAATAGAAVCAALVAVLTLGNGGSTVTPADDPNPMDTPSPPAMPTEVTCANGVVPRSAEYDHSGYDTFTRMVTREAESHGAYIVDRSSRTIYFVRADGTAHTAVPVSLDVGHCWIEPLEFGDRTWDVMEEDQFGYGGGVPSGFTGTGTARRHAPHPGARR